MLKIFVKWGGGVFFLKDYVWKRSPGWHQTTSSFSFSSSYFSYYSSYYSSSSYFNTAKMWTPDIAMHQRINLYKQLTKKWEENPKEENSEKFKETAGQDHSWCSAPVPGPSPQHYDSRPSFPAFRIKSWKYYKHGEVYLWLTAAKAISLLIKLFKAQLSLFTPKLCPSAVFWSTRFQRLWVAKPYVL